MTNVKVPDGVGPTVAERELLAQQLFDQADNLYARASEQRVVAVRNGGIVLFLYAAFVTFMLADKINPWWVICLYLLGFPFLWGMLTSSPQRLMKAAEKKRGDALALLGRQP